MARPLRLEFPGAIYHLTSRGNARQKVFFTDADREVFLTTLSGVVSRYGWICHAYCLMANHYHLLVETPKANLSIGMRRFKAILIERESHLLELCRYIVLNPLRIKGSGKPQTWKWSSYRATAGLASVPPFLSIDWILQQFARNRSQAQKQYREFVREGLASRPWDELKGQIYLGSEAFIEKHAAGKKRLKEIPRAQWRAAKPSLQRIFATKGKKAIAEAYEHGYRLNEIAAHLGVHYATVSRRLKQIEQAN